ncbi:alpha/beta fold hydrolase [uncultured Leifsonia sp.]|uniref:alpha/beta fold hydrolase n=1 Tax=uncultured Leifsonia sp. TaxID=340359 RepID=UPI0028D43AC6|nr:alpha/beta fold hydrolase [uncultured Leifsonia sp.]
MTFRQIELAGGHTVGMSGIGDPVAEHLAVLFHPTPGASAFDPDPHATDRSGLHIIGFDRPGYGSSEAWDVTVDGWVDAVARYLRAMERSADLSSATRYGRISAIGWREGAVYATALAARHPDLLHRLVLVSPLAPANAARAEHPPIDAPAPGAAARPAGYDDRLRRMLDDACRQGEVGVLADRRAFAAVGSAAPRVDADALIVYGSADDDATVHDADWYAAGLTNATVDRVDGGSDLIARHWERILRFLAE